MKLNAKKFIPYLFFVVGVILIIIMSDESRMPIDINAKDMAKENGTVENTAVVIREDSEYSGLLLRSPGHMLDKGIYTIGLSFNTDTDGNSLTIYDNGKTLGTYTLDPNSTYQEFTVELEKTSPDFTFTIDYGGTGFLRVLSASLIPGGQFYKDTGYLITVFLICNILFFLWRHTAKKRNVSTVTDYTVLFLIGIGVMSSMPFFKSGLNWAIDLCYHLVRIEGIKDGLLAGQFPVVIYPEALHGNGYLNCMYPSLFLYFPALLRMIGVSMADSYKTLIILFNLATAFITYHCVKTIGGSGKAALLASLLYTCCPYRFTNVYARGAVGEFLAMTFLPLVFAGLYHIFIGDRKKWGYLVLGMTGLLQTHILSVTLAGVFCGIFGILYLKEVILDKRYIEVMKAVLASLLLNLGFLIPFLSYYTGENLWMNALDLGTYQEYTLNLSGLLGTISTGDYYVLTLGIPLGICGMIALSYLFLEHKKDANETYVAYLFVLGIVMTFMMLQYFPGWRIMELSLPDIILSKIQFAWRLLGPVSLLLAVTGSICLFRSSFLKEYSRILFVVLAGICLISVTRFRDEDFAYSYDRNYSFGHMSKLTGIPKGENTVVYPYEWRLKNTLDSGIITTVGLSDSTKINLMDYTRTGTDTKIQYTCVDENQYMEVPVVFYRGYEAIDENGETVELETGYNNKIRVLLKGDSIPHQLTIYYKMPLSFTVSAWISILTAAAWCILICFRKYRNSKLKQITELQAKGKEFEDVG